MITADPPLKRHGIFVAGGGTAGHVLPALAVARALIGEGVDPLAVHFVGSRRGMESHLVPEAGFGITLLPGRGIVRHLNARNIAAIVGLGFAALRSIMLILRWRPRAVVAVGGYAALPCAVGALLCRRPVVVVNLDSVPGATNRLIGRFARASAVAFPGTALPRAVLTGAPVRDEVLAIDRSAAGRAHAKDLLDIPADRRVVAIAGGSLGARRLNEAALGLAELFADRADLCLFHLCGERSFAEVSARADALNKEAGLLYRLVAFEPQLPELFGAADLVISRAGASTVAELMVIGTPSILVPLPNAPSDHQRKNADLLVAAGAARLLLDDDVTTPRLAEAIDELLGDPAQLGAMEQAAQVLGRRDAAKLIAQLVLETAEPPRRPNDPVEKNSEVARQ